MRIIPHNFHRIAIPPHIVSQTKSLTLPQPTHVKVFAALSYFSFEGSGVTVKVGISQFRFMNAENQEETHRFGPYSDWPPTVTHHRMTQVAFGLVVDARFVTGFLAATFAEGFVNVVIFD